MTDALIVREPNPTDWTTADLTIETVLPHLDAWLKISAIDVPDESNRRLLAILIAVFAENVAHQRVMKQITTDHETMRHKLDEIANSVAEASK